MAVTPAVRPDDVHRGQRIRPSCRCRAGRNAFQPQHFTAPPLVSAQVCTLTGRDGRHAGSQPDDVDRGHAVARRAVAELAVDVGAPALHSPAASQRAGVIAAGGDGRHAGTSGRRRPPRSAHPSSCRCRAGRTSFNPSTSRRRRWSARRCEPAGRDGRHAGASARRRPRGQRVRRSCRCRAGRNRSSPSTSRRRRWSARRCGRRRRRWPSRRLVSPTTSTAVSCMRRRAVAELAVVVASPST